MALAAFSNKEPILPSALDTQLAQETNRILAPLMGSTELLQLRVQGRDEIITLPPSAFRLLIDILTNMAAGNALTLIPIHAELTTQQAADLLNVSRKFLIDELLGKQKIPFHKVGTHRRIRFQDLMHYKQETQTQRMEAIDQLVQLDQSIGLD